MEEDFDALWKLLSHTNDFLNLTPLYADNEERIREWALRLQENREDQDILLAVKKELVEFRKELRIHGYNPALAKYTVKTVGFKADDSVEQGFARAVLYNDHPRVFVIVGQDNHNQQIATLRDRLSKRGIPPVSPIHSIWYRWNRSLLEIGGGGCEEQEDFYALCQDIEKYPFKYIQGFLKY